MFRDTLFFGFIGAVTFYVAKFEVIFWKDQNVQAFFKKSYTFDYSKKNIKWSKFLDDRRLELQFKKNDIDSQLSDINKGFYKKEGMIINPAVFRKF